LKAGNIISLITPIVGRRSGGKPDMAEGGENLPEKLGDAINSSYRIIDELTAKQ
jgi:alanyl-tRNA synthetase